MPNAVRHFPAPPQRWFPLSSSTPVFLAGVLLFTVSCRKNGTPDWQTEITRPSEATVEGGNPAEKRPDFSAPPAAAFPTQISGKSPAFRFLSYNVRNWLPMERTIHHTVSLNAPKPEKERAAVVSVITAQAPDVLGLSEIGAKSDLSEIQTRLKNSGLDLPHAHFSGGADPVRHLGFLSRFPITSTAAPAETTFRLHGTPYTMNRGILDATVSIHGTSVRFLGVHLKSKRPAETFDQEQMRLFEAKLVRKHADAILSRDPLTRLIVYGDFNDTRATPTLKSISGGTSDAFLLTALPLKDRTGATWTHRWELNDIYSRIDFVFVSRSLRRGADPENSRIIDEAPWETASDHRPLLVIFR